MVVIRASLEGSGLFRVARVLQRSAELPWTTRADLYFQSSPFWRSYHHSRQERSRWRGGRYALAV